jgi:hypothetical protein
MDPSLSWRSRALVVTGVVASIVVLAFWIAPDPSPPDDDGDPFTGRWLVNGTSAEGVEYSGSLIIRIAGDRYDLQWLVTGGRMEGDGVFADGRLEARWASADGLLEGRTGSATYTIDADGMLHGRLTTDGVAGSGVEEAALAS